MLTSKMMKKLLQLPITIFLFSCAGINTVSVYEANSKNSIKVTNGSKVFVVLDDENKSAALVMEDNLTDAGKAFVEGLFIMLIDLTAPVGAFESAMQNYLAEYKDTDCEITRSNFISDGMGGGIGYEIFYKCN